MKWYAIIFDSEKTEQTLLEASSKKELGLLLEGQLSQTRLLLKVIKGREVQAVIRHKIDFMSKKTQLTAEE